MLHRRRAKRVGGADERLLPGRLQQVGQLADGRRLSGAVDADNHRHVGMVTIRRRPLDRVEDLPDLFLHQVAEAFTVPGP